MPGGGGKEVGNVVAGGFISSFGEGDEGTRCEGNGLVVEVGLGLDVVAGDVGNFERRGGVSFCGFEAFGEGDAVGFGSKVDTVGEGDLGVLGGEEGRSGELPVVGDDAAALEESGGEEDGVVVGGCEGEGEFLEGDAGGEHWGLVDGCVLR